MGDGSLSQDEIDALLQGTDDVGTSIPSNFVSQGAEQASSTMSAPEQNAVVETLRSIVTAVVPPLSGYLGGRDISLVNVSIEAKPRNAIVNDFQGQYVQVAMDFQGVLNGKNVILYSSQDAGLISSVMMSNDTTAAVELTDAHLSTIQEFTSTFLSSIATQLGNRLGGTINTTPASLNVANNASELQIPSSDPIKATYDLSMDGVSNFKIYHIIDANITQNLVPSMGGGGGMGQKQFQQPFQQGYAQGGFQGGGFQQRPQFAANPADMSYVKFPPLDAGIAQSNQGDITLLLDVPMTLTVELGRTSKLIQEILGFGEGSIIELDKLAGEPVDLLVNGKLIARGEVVVIDENFGVRITEIVSPDERLLRLAR